MDNTRAGLAAVETGALRRQDVLTDVFLAAAWTEAASAAADLAAVGDPSLSTPARKAASRARASLNRRFLDDERRRIHFALMKGGRGQSEQTVWPAFGIRRGVFDVDRPAVDGMLDELARAGVGTDWGARMLSRESARFEQQTYTARLQGLSGRCYRVRLDVPFEVTAIEGGRLTGTDGATHLLEVEFPVQPAPWAEVTVAVKVGQRRAANRPAGGRGVAPQPVAHSRSIHP